MPESITLRHIGKSAEDLRFFIEESGAHAGGITVHSLCGDAFSYGIAVAAQKRRRGVARRALEILLAQMKSRGFSRAFVDVAPQNAASLALHASLGFCETGRSEQAVRLEKAL